MIYIRGWNCLCDDPNCLCFKFKKRKREYGETNQITQWKLYSEIVEVK